MQLSFDTWLAHELSNSPEGVLKELLDPGYPEFRPLDNWFPC